MARVIVTKPAQKDLVDIRAYIRDELCNPGAAKRIISELKKSISARSSFSGRGRPLDALIPVHTDYRYLVCEDYCIFYLSSDDEVLVVRVLHQRQDCLKALFLYS